MSSAVPCPACGALLVMSFMLFLSSAIRDQVNSPSLPCTGLLCIPREDGAILPHECPLAQGAQPPLFKKRGQVGVGQQGRQRPGTVTTTMGTPGCCWPWPCSCPGRKGQLWGRVQLCQAMLCCPGCRLRGCTPWPCCVLWSNRFLLCPAMPSSATLHRPTQFQCHPMVECP